LKAQGYTSEHLDNIFNCSLEDWDNKGVWFVETEGKSASCSVARPKEEGCVD